MSKKNLLIAFILVLLSLLWLFVPHTSCEAAETYTITAQELTTLEVELNRASKAIANSKTESAMLQKQLTDLQTSLTEAKQQSMQLKEQLKALTVTSKQQQTQLQNANQSLTALSKEMKQQQRSLERQRNIAYIIAAGMMYLAVRNT